MFLDPMHVRKNMGAALGASRSVGISLYDQALYAPSVSMVDEIVSRYSEQQAKYLGKFDKSMLYRAYSSLEDTIVTSQGAESQMCASLRNHIRSVEPQKMIMNVVFKQRAGFLQRQAASMECKNPLPPSMEKHTAYLIERSRAYQSTVKITKQTPPIEATVASYKDGSKLRHVRFTEDGKIPVCCAYAVFGDGFPCYHAVAVICQKYGQMNVHQFIEPKNQTTAWKKLYNGVMFSIPTQSEVDDVISNAKLAVLSKKNLEIPRALPPPRGRPQKNAGVRRKGWYEQGPSTKKKRSYSCSLCHRQGHVRNHCPLRQIFQGNSETMEISPSKDKETKEPADGAQKSAEKVA